MKPIKDHGVDKSVKHTLILLQKKVFNSLLLRKYYRIIRGFTYGYSDLIKISKAYGKKLKTTKKKKYRILMATSVGHERLPIKMESLLGFGLHSRDCEIDFILCDKVLSACSVCNYITFNSNYSEFIANGPIKYHCPGCFSSAERALKHSPFSIKRYSEFISCAEQKNIDRVVSEIKASEIEEYQLNGINIGMHAVAGALKFLTRCNVGDDSINERILRRFFKASFQTTIVFQNLFKSRRYDCVVLNHGIYIPQGPIVETAKEMGIRVVTWNLGYPEKTFIFSHGDTYHHTLLEEPSSTWEHLSLDQNKSKNIDQYLKSRITGGMDWITFQDKSFIGDQSGLDRLIGGKKCVGLFTNVLWDAQVHYKQNAFPNMIDWVLASIRYFLNKKQYVLIIRVHPAEKRNMLPSKQTVEEEINFRYPTLPDNIVVIPALSSIKSYHVAAKSIACLIYGTKMGVELTTMGKPIVVGGEAWIRNKGLTFDATSKEQYLELLENIDNLKMTEKQIFNAKQYAYHFFFRRCVPCKLLNYTKNIYPPFNLDVDVEKLSSGNDLGFDLICDGIVYGIPFVYKAND